MFARLSVWGASASAPPSPEWRVTEKEGGLSISLDKVAWRDFPLPGSQNNESIIRATGAAYTRKVGFPELPVYRLLVAVPPGVEPSLTRSESNILTRQKSVTPVGVWSQDSKGFSVDRTSSVSSSQTGIIYPGSWATLKPWTQFRGLRLYVLEIAPFQQQLLTGRLLEHTNMKIEVEWGTSSGRGGPHVEDRYLPLVRQMVINPDQASQMGTESLSLDVNEGWDLSYPGLKIKAPPGRPVVITNEQISGYAPELANRRVDELTLWWKGEQLPSFVEVNQNGVVDRIIVLSPPLPDEYKNESFSNYFWLCEGDGLLTMEIRESGTSEEGVTEVGIHPVTATFAQEVEHYGYNSSRTALLWWWTKLETKYSGHTSEGNLSFRMGEFADSEPVKLTLHGRADSWRSHHMKLSLAGTQVADTSWTGSGDYEVYARLPSDRVFFGSNLLKVEMVGTESESDVTWVKAFTLDFFSGKATEDSLLFSSPEEINGNLRLAVGGFRQSDVIVLDVTDPIRPIEINGAEVLPAVGGAEYSVIFQDSVPPGITRTYLAFSASRETSIPALEYRSEHVLPTATGADYMVLSHPLFMDQATRLAEFRSSGGYQTLSVDVEEIFDRFSYGYPASQGVKDFITWAYDSFDPRPGFVVLLGDGSSRLRHGNDTSPNLFPDRLLSGFADDNDYVDVDNDSHHVPDLAIGRLSVQTPEQAEDFVDKIIAAETEVVPSAAHSQYVMFADDQSGVANLPGFAYDCEEIIESISPAYFPERIYLSYNGGSNDAWNDREVMLASRAKGAEYYRPWIIDALREGRLLLTYVGHGGVNTWATEWIITTDDIEEFITSPNYPLISNFSCDTGRFDDPDYDIVMSEHFTRWREGAIACFSASRASYPSDNRPLSIHLHEALFNDGITEIGLAVQSTKLQTDLSYVCRAYALLGDPASVLPIAPLESLDLAVEPSVVSAGTPMSLSLEWPNHSIAEVTTDLVDAHGISLYSQDGQSLALPASLSDVATPVAPPSGTGFLRTYVVNGADESVGYASFTSPANIDTGAVTPETGSNGYIASRDGNILISFPPGAVASSTVARITSYAVNRVTTQRGMDFCPLPGAGQGYVYRIALDNGEELMTDAELSMAYDSNWLLPADADSLMGARWAEDLDRYIGLGGSVADERIGFFSSTLGEFTVLVVYDASPPIITRTEILRGVDWALFGDGEFVLGSSVNAEIAGQLIETSWESGTNTSEGQLTFEVPDLGSGTHKLILSCSDIYGNEGTHTITLRAGSGLQIAGLAAVPSPFERSTHIRFVLSEEATEAEARVYTVSGRLIRTLTSGTPNQGTNLIKWDGRDEDGDRIAGGVYFLRLKVAGDSGTTTAKTKVVKRAS